MELSEAKEFWKNRAECFRIEIKNNKGETPKDVLEKEKLEYAAQSIDTVLKALDNSVSKDEVRELIQEESAAGQEAKKEHKPEMQVTHEYTRLTLKSLLGE